jgi:23S rRNA pseudouridine1911/1915/1917 synthase
MPACKNLPQTAAYRYATRMSGTDHPDHTSLTQNFTIIAPENAAGQRADRFLAELMGTISRSRVKSLIEAGFVTVNGRTLTAPAEAVRAGASYNVTPPTPVAATPAAQTIPFPILFEDEYLLVLDKPAGLVVHPAPGNEDGTLVNALLAHCGDTLPGIGGEKRPGIVHRLDRDTSGVMVVAKSELALTTLSAAFAERNLERAYIALAWGLTDQACSIDAPIGRDPRDRKRMAVRSSGGKQALTHFRTEQSWLAAVSRLTCRLATGRTHQIRVHLAHSGHPIIGDPVYLRRIPAAARAVPEPLRSKLLDFPRQALHAAILGFSHPITGEKLRFETPPPADLAALIAALNEA